MLDTDALYAELELSTPEQRVAFAAACLDLLVQQFGELGKGADLLPKPMLSEVVAFCWQSVCSLPENLSDVEMFYSRAREILAEDDEGRLFVGEHVLSGMCYALRCVELRNSENAVLVASNYYEAADYATIIDDPNLSDSEILAAPLVAGVLKRISSVLLKTRSINASLRAEVEAFRAAVALLD